MTPHPNTPEAVYLKVIAFRNGKRSREIIRFVKVSTGQVFLAVDLTRNRIAEVRSLYSVPYMIEPSCKEEFDEAYDKVLASLRNTSDQR